MAKVLFDEAKKGEGWAQKIVWDRVLPPRKSIDGTDRGGNMQITINVNGIESIGGEPIEAEFQEEE